MKKLFLLAVMAGCMFFSSGIYAQTRFLEKADQLIKEKKYEELETFLQDAIERERVESVRRKDALVKLGELYWELNRPLSAVNCYKKFGKTFMDLPDAGPVLVKWAKSYEACAQFLDAAALYRDIVKRNHKRETIAQRLYEIYYILGDRKNMDREIGRIKKEHGSEDWTARVYLSYAARNNNPHWKGYRQSANGYETFIAKHSKDWRVGPAYQQLISVYMHIDKSKAVLKANEFVKRFGSKIDKRYWYGFLSRYYSELKQYKNSAEAFRKLAELDGDKSQYYWSAAANSLRGGRNQAAVDAYKKCIEMAPNDLGCHYTLGREILFEMEKYEQALPHMKKYFTDGGSNEKIVDFILKAYEKLNKKDQGYTYLEQQSDTVKNGQVRWRAFYTLARHYAHAKKPDLVKAAVFYKKAAQANPWIDDTLEDMANIYLRHKKADLMQPVLLACAKKYWGFKNGVRNSLYYAMNMLKRNKLDAMAKEVNQALHHVPSKETAGLFSKALSLDHKKKWKDAVNAYMAVYDKLDKSDTNKGRVGHLAYAIMNKRLRKDKSVIPHIEKLCNEGRNYYWELAWDRRKQMNADQHYNHCKRYIMKTGVNHGNWHWRKVFYEYFLERAVKLKKWDDATDVLADVIKRVGRDKNLAQGLALRLADIYSSKGDSGKSQEWFFKAIAMKPYTDYYNNNIPKRFATMTTGKAKTTPEMIEKVMQAFRPNPTMDYFAGRYYFYRKKYDKAIAYFNKSLAKTFGESSEVLARIGDCYLAQKKTEPALDAYMKCLKTMHINSGPGADGADITHAFARIVDIKNKDDKSGAAALKTIESFSAYVYSHDYYNLVDKKCVADKDHLNRLVARQHYIWRSYNDKTAWNANYKLARSYYNRKEYEPAAVLFRSLHDRYHRQRHFRDEARTAKSLSNKSFAKVVNVAVEIDDSLPHAPLLHAGVRLRLGEKEKAWQMYLKNKAIFEKYQSQLSPDFIHFVAKRKMLAGNFEESINICRLFILKNMKNRHVDASAKARIQILLGDNYFNQQKYDTARSEYKSVISYFPNTMEVYDARFKVGECFMEQRMFAEAEKVFEKLQKTRDHRDIRIRARFMIGVVANRKGEKEEAKKAFQEVLALSPTTDQANEALFHLSETFKNESRYSEELHMLRMIGMMGREDMQYVQPGQPLNVILRDAELQISQGKKAIPVIVTTTTGDRERILLTQSSAGAGFFQGSIVTVLGKPVKGDEKLQVDKTAEISYDYAPEFKKGFHKGLVLSGNKIRIASDGVIKAASVKIKKKERSDIARRLAKASEWMKKGKEKADHVNYRNSKEVKPGNPVYVLVSDPDSTYAGDCTVPVKLRASSGDILVMNVKEEDPFTGVFRAVIKTELKPPDAFASDNALGKGPLFGISGNRSADNCWEGRNDAKSPKWFAVDLKDVYPITHVEWARGKGKDDRLPTRWILQASNKRGGPWRNLASHPESLIENNTSIYGRLRFQTRKRRARKSPENLAEMKKIVAQSKHVYGTQYWGWINDSKNPFGPQDNYISIYWGFFYCAKGGKYTFALKSDDAAFLLVDGVPVVSKLGAGDWQKGKEVSLSEGVHKIRCYHEEGRGGNYCVAGWIPPSSNDGKIVVMPKSVFSVNEHEEIKLAEKQELRSRGIVTGQVSMDKKGAGASITFPEPVETRFVRLNILEFTGNAPAIAHFAVKAMDKQIVPTNINPVTMLKDDILQISPGDSVVVSYQDTMNISEPGRSRILKDVLRATYFNGKVAIVNYAFSDDRGRRVKREKQVRRIKVGQRFVIKVTDYDEDETDKRDTITVVAESTSGGRIEKIARETSAFSGVFVSEVFTTDDKKDSKKLYVGPKDDIYAWYYDKMNTSPGNRTKRFTRISIVQPSNARIAIKPSIIIKTKDGKRTQKELAMKLVDTPLTEDLVVKVVPQKKTKQDAGPDTEAEGPPEDASEPAEKNDPAEAENALKSDDDLADAADEDPQKTAKTDPEPATDSKKEDADVLFTVPQEYNPKLLSITAKIQVFVVDPDQALDSESSVKVQLVTTAGVRRAITCRVSGADKSIVEYCQKQPDLARLFDTGLGFLGMGGGKKGGRNKTKVSGLDLGVFSGGISLALGDSNSPDFKIPTYRKAFALSGSGVSKGHKIPVLNITGQDFIMAYYRDEINLSDDEHFYGDFARMVTGATIGFYDVKYKKKATITNVGEKVYVMVKDADADKTGNPDTLPVTLTTDLGDELNANLLETLSHSGVFIGSYELKYSKKPKPENEWIEADFGNKIKAVYMDPLNPEGEETKENHCELLVIEGADGTVVPFSKSFVNEDVAIETNFKMSECYFELFKKHLKLKKKEIANEELRKGINILKYLRDNYDPKKIGARVAFLFGNYAQELKQYDDAINHYRELIIKWPDNVYAPKAQYKVAQCYEKSNEFKKACEEYVKLAYTYPDSPLIADAIIRIGKYFFDLKEYIQAYNVLSRLEKKFPHHPLVERVTLKSLFALSLDAQSYPEEQKELLAIRQKKYQTAAAKYSEFLDKYPKSKLKDQAYYWGGDAYMKSENFEKAYVMFKTLTLNFPESKWAAYARGQLTAPVFSKVKQGR